MIYAMKNWLVPPHFIALADAVIRRRPLSAMKPILLDTAEWILPAEWQALLVQCGHRARGIDVRTNEALRGRHRDRNRCFVIGNGPSLGQMDLRPLRDELTIGANSFYMHPQADEVQLDYLCCGDGHFFTDEPRAVEWHRTIERRMPGATLMMNPLVLTLMARHELYRKHRVHVFQNGPKTSHPAQVRFDFTRPLNVGVTTGSLLAIPLAICMGVREIYLVGFDCNWLETFADGYHFYKRHDIWKEFDSVSADTRSARYEAELNSALKEFRAHDLIARRTRQLGVRVFNATEGGRLDTYPRVRYDELF
jgi:hypothetical protein